MRESYYVRLERASDPNTSVEDLWQFSKDDSPTIRGRVARNPATPRDLLQKIALYDVFAGTSACDRLPTPILLDLHIDGHYPAHIRWELSGRSDTPGSVLINFPDCASRVLWHPNLPYGAWLATIVHIRVLP